MKLFFRACTTAIAGLILASCTGHAGDTDIRLKNKDDSLSFAVSMLISEDMPAKMVREKIDSTTVDDFIRGLRMAFPLEDTPENRAFINGIYAAVEAAEMLKKADEAIYPDENEKRVDRRLFLEGLVATASGNTGTMDAGTAKKYYHQQVFRSRSEQFMADNRQRPGVVTLESGVQYKIELMGKGDKASYSGIATCIFKGMYPNGATFTSSHGKAVDLTVSDLVPGLAEVLTTLPQGTRFKAYVPWDLGYGAKGGDGIAPYSTLVYDIEIVDVR